MRGHIRRRSAGRWEISVETPSDPVSGRRRRTWRVISGTRREAERELTALVRAVDTGTLVDPTRETVAAYLTRWLRDYALHGVAPRTYERYAEIIRGHIVPAIGGVTMSRLRPAHVVEAERTWLDRLSPSTVLKHHRLLHEAFEQAVRWQVIAVNPMRAVTAPRPPRREMVVLDADQARALLDVASGTEFDCALTTLLYTGLRLGELRGLRWRDVDLEGGHVRIQQTMQRIGGELRFAPTKTHRSRRNVEVPAIVVEALRRERTQQTARRLAVGGDWNDLGLVFTDALGRPISAERLRWAFWRLLDRAGLPRVRLHDLRHTMATLMLTAGEHPKVVSERLGHSTVTLTLDTYSHVLPGIGRAAAERLAETLAPRQ